MFFELNQWFLKVDPVFEACSIKPFFKEFCLISELGYKEGHCNQAFSWLCAKGLAVEESRRARTVYELTALGREAAGKGTAEERILRFLSESGPARLPEIAAALGLEQKDVGSAYGLLSKEGALAMDAEKLKSILELARELVDDKSGELRILLNSPSLNPGSPKQLKEALSCVGIEVPNTNQETLKAADEGRIIPAILALRGAEKSAQQAESLLDSIESDRRIHGRFEPTGTDTGRFSSKSPNLQNIGRGELRDCFIAPPGSCLIVADYSQIELRAAAAIAGETKMVEAYKRGDDLHKLTAAIVLGKPLGDVTKGDRQLSKAVNFGLLFGQGARGLVRYAATAYGVVISEDEAADIRKAFFRNYDQLHRWHDESNNTAEIGVSEVRTVLGRRRLMPSDADAWQRFTALVNTPVQGSCADGMKKALLLIAARLPESARLISTVHDEVIVEATEAEAERVLTIVRESMVEAMVELFPQVPIEVEAGVCNKWSEK